jgi:hypothetical protein
MYLDPKVRAEADHALRAPDLVVSPRLRWHLEAIRGNSRQLEAIRGNQRLRWHLVVQRAAAR